MVGFGAWHQVSDTVFYWSISMLLLEGILFVYLSILLLSSCKRINGK